MTDALLHLTHLEELFQATERKHGSNITSISIHNPSMKMMEALDCGYLTIRKMGYQYLHVVIGGLKIWAMYDTGTNFTMITGKFAKQLGF